LDPRQSGFDVQIRRNGPIHERIQCAIVQGTPPSHKVRVRPR
jgi:hypothetical protein